MSRIDKKVYRQVFRDLSAALPDGKVSRSLLRRLAMGTDASFYRLVPEIVVEVDDSAQVQQVLAVTRRYQVPVTFRAAGTSLSGQAVTDSVLVCLGWGWNCLEVLEQGAAIRVQPGVVGADANKALLPHRRKIGPDPASINSARMGGIAANNASGMCCGTASNTYSTLRSIRLVLAGGAILDTADTASRNAFGRSHADLLEQLATMARQVRSDEVLAARIRHKYRLKNTMGYALNALLDFVQPFDILAHLMVGSEGTLGFISELVLDTVADHPHKATALLIFSSPRAACAVIPRLHDLASAIELIDQRGLQAVADKPGMPAGIELDRAGLTALLVELEGADNLILSDTLRAAEQCLQDVGLLAPAEFSCSAERCNALWALRKGLFPAVGAVRPAGTTVVIEDIAVPVEQLGAAVSELQHLFDRFGYQDAVIFGHARDGNLHFVFSQSFASAQQVTRYEQFMQAVVDMVVQRFDGSLKAEHGTGRNMAPFVEQEWGVEAYGLMRQIKQLFDPHDLLNPGVIINDDSRVHLKNLKPLPATDALIDRCIECGFCEPTCPSRRLTLTPRQRIVLRREMGNAESGYSRWQRRELRRDYHYQGVDTCAACGLCETSCPVAINTGDLTRQQRGVEKQRYQWLATWIGRHYADVSSAARATLRVSDVVRKIFGEAPLEWLFAALHRISCGKITRWHQGMPHARSPVSVGEYLADNGNGDKIIYFPACMGRVMDPARLEADTLVQQTVTLLNRAGFDVLIPPGLDELCCGLPFDSKGFADMAAEKRRELGAVLHRISEGGKISVYSDTTACTQQMMKGLGIEIDILDTIECLHDRVLPRLKLQALDTTVALHTTCSATRQGLGDKLEAIARACAREVFIPEHISCCGFAGDKGFTLVQLNSSALGNLHSQLPLDCNTGYSTSTTCEIGLSRVSGIPYRGIVELVEQASRGTHR